MHQCRKCKTRIADDRRYCYKHYQEALAQYKRDLKQYEIELENWRELPAQARQFANSEAEAQVIFNYSLLAGLAVGLLCWFLLSTKWQFDILYGLVLTAAITLAFPAIPTLRLASGRTARACRKSIKILLWLGILTLVLSVFSEIVKKYVGEVLMMDMLIALVYSFHLESTGRFQASGAPTKPSKPIQ